VVAVSFLLVMLSAPTSLRIVLFFKNRRMFSLGLSATLHFADFPYALS
jgi:hypothetical protein